MRRRKSTNEGPKNVGDLPPSATSMLTQQPTFYATVRRTHLRTSPIEVLGAFTGSAADGETSVECEHHLLAAVQPLATADARAVSPRKVD